MRRPASRRNIRAEDNGVFSHCPRRAGLRDGLRESAALNSGILQRPGPSRHCQTASRPFDPWTDRIPVSPPLRRSTIHCRASCESHRRPFRHDPASRVVDLRVVGNLKTGERWVSGMDEPAIRGNSTPATTHTSVWPWQGNKKSVCPKRREPPCRASEHFDDRLHHS